MCGSRKYPYPHHGGNWKFQRGGGVKGPGNSGEEGGLLVNLRFQMVKFDAMQIVSKSFLTYSENLLHRKHISLCFLYMTILHFKPVFFFLKEQ